MRFLAALLTVTVISACAPGWEIYQNLDEATSRIDRLSGRPYEKLIDADHLYQSETLIFQEETTGREIWSLSMEQCVDTANVERRMVFSCDGSVLSMKGNKSWKKLDGTIYHTSWDGYNYLMNADLTDRRKLWVDDGGVLKGLTNKFDTWDRQTPRRLYYAVDNKLYRVTVGNGAFDNTAEVIYTFPNSAGKFIQTINDDNILCIQDDNGDVSTDNPLFYVIDLKKDPSDPDFCRYHGMQYGITGVPGHDPNNEYHVHVIGVGRGSNRVGWNYGPMTSEGESVHFSVPIDNLDSTPAWSDASNDPYGQYRSHPGTGFDGRSAYFAGPTTPPSDPQGWGIWVRLVATAPVYTNKPASGGHATWCGNDPDWYFANISRRDPPWSNLDGKIVAGNADGSEPVMLCEPYDRKRGGTEVWSGIPRPNQSPDATKCWYHSSMLLPSDSYVGSYIVVFRRPHAPVGLIHNGSYLSFTPHAVSQEVKSYLLYRQDGAQWQFVKEVPAAEGGCSLTAEGTYMVTALEWSGLESDTSSATITIPGGATGPSVTNWDSQAPSAPTNLIAVNEAAGQNRLTWGSSPDQDVRYYNLYFSDTSHPPIQQQRRFASPPKTTTEYLDWTAPTTGQAYYAVTAVDRQGNESMPARWPAPTYHTLTVSGGTGDGDYIAAWLVEISADAPGGGQAFDQWVGDTAGIADVNAPDTTIVMPDSNAVVTATYNAAYELTVVSGSGSGQYVAGAEVTISAADPPAGKMFFEWTGDIAGVADVTSADTTIIMPPAPTEVTAIYAAIPGQTLLVDFGSSAEQNVFGLNGWDTVWLGNYTSYSAEGPAGIMGGWTGQWHCQQISGPIRHFAEGEEVVVTWYNTGVTVTWTPKVSFEDPDSYNNGDSGTWYDMTETTVLSGQTATSHFVIDASAAGDYSLVNVCRTENETDQLLCDKIELIEDQPPTANDDSCEVQADGLCQVPAPGVLANDVDPEGKPLTAEKVTDPEHGLLTLNADGSFEYQGDPGYHGPDSFTYRAHDGSQYGNIATVTVSVLAAPAELTGDLDGSGHVGQGDLDILLDKWGQLVAPDDPADPTGDGHVGQPDLDIVLDNWGTSAP